MTIETAYTAFTDAVAAALVAVDFLSAPTDLNIDPEDLVEPTGDELQILSAATVEKGETGPVRQILGRPEQRWVVERTCRVELMQYGPASDQRRTIDAAAVAAMAQLSVNAPNLSGACERLTLTESDETPVDPNGVARSFTFTLRVRSGDPLGVTA